MYLEPHVRQPFVTVWLGRSFSNHPRYHVNDYSVTGVKFRVISNETSDKQFPGRWRSGVRRILSIDLLVGEGTIIVSLQHLPEI